MAGSSINTVDASGRTPSGRHLDVIRRCEDLVNLLLTGGANPNASDEGGQPRGRITDVDPFSFSTGG